MTEVFVEQPLASPGSAKYMLCFIVHLLLSVFVGIGLFALPEVTQFVELLN